jgi:hypothetical protein
MIQENEAITLFLCLGTLTFIIINHVKLKSLPKIKLLIASFIFFSLGWFFTVFEHIIFEEIFNLIEHLCYLSSSIILGIWTVFAFQKKGLENESSRIN